MADEIPHIEVTEADVAASFDSLAQTALRIKAERDLFLLALKRIREKADTGLREDGGRFAVQTLDAIDEIAEAAILKRTLR